MCHDAIHVLLDERDEVLDVRSLRENEVIRMKDILILPCHLPDSDDLGGAIMPYGAGVPPAGALVFARDGRVSC